MNQYTLLPVLLRRISEVAVEGKFSRHKAATWRLAARTRKSKAHKLKEEVSGIDGAVKKLNCLKITLKSCYRRIADIFTGDGSRSQAERRRHSNKNRVSYNMAAIFVRHVAAHPSFCRDVCAQDTRGEYDTCACDLLQLGIGNRGFTVNISKLLKETISY
ncbi:hypothetical protein JYU34_016228 [Plutella xylostella]|uniref:Uncharacterized protein n=1 Tax=Plutella xylostella TaxID=51655 RepID=A0ABQ7Q250_PLUXY|nr:hypothetical protein JYU34_016228 [Plutella xylostella]